jgi:hypothetical protein
LEAPGAANPANRPLNPQLNSGTSQYNSANKSPWGNHPRLQILTIEELLGGAEIDCPPAKHVDVTYKKAQKARKDERADQVELGLED